MKPSLEREKLIQVVAFPPRTTWSNNCDRRKRP